MYPERKNGFYSQSSRLAEEKLQGGDGLLEDRPAHEDFTIIIPTLNEARNIGVLLGELAASYPGIGLTVMDDDSHDGTANVVREAGKVLSANIAVIERRTATDKGLTASVLDGIMACRTPYFLVMDGDFQHPPSLVSLLQVALRQGHDLAVACRRSVPNDYSRIRRFVSHCATVAAQFVLGRSGMHCADPLSGCFGGRTTAVHELIKRHDAVFVRGGYKILFELLKIIAAETAAGRSALSLTEVNYDFANRGNGSSKFRPVHALLFCRSLIRRCQEPKK